MYPLVCVCECVRAPMRVCVFTCTPSAPRAPSVCVPPGLGPCDLAPPILGALRLGRRHPPTGRGGERGRDGDRKEMEHLCLTNESCAFTITLLRAEIDVRSVENAVQRRRDV